MAKPLTTKPPTSSVTRLLDLASAARAVAPAGQPQAVASAAPQVAPPATSTPAQPTLAAPATSDHPCIKRELVLTRAADQTFTRLVESCRQGTGTKLTASHVARALLAAVDHAMPEIAHEAARIGIQKLPSNARTSADERARFEALIADALLVGLGRAARGE